MAARKSTAGARKKKAAARRTSRKKAPARKKKAAARKKTATGRKKAASPKKRAGARKKAAGRKKAASRRKKAAAPRKKKAAARRKASGRKKSGLVDRTREAIAQNLRDLERELPKGLKSVIGEVRKGVEDLEKQIEQARDEGEARWKDLESQIRGDSEKILERFGLDASSREARRRRRVAAKRSTGRDVGKTATRKKPAKGRSTGAKKPIATPGRPLRSPRS